MNVNLKLKKAFSDGKECSLIENKLKQIQDFKQKY